MLRSLTIFLAGTGFLAFAPSVSADTTPINPAPGSEEDLDLPGGILDQLYGLTNLERIDDFDAPGNLPDDQLWTNTGSGTVVAEAKFAGLANTLGYFDGESSTTFVSLFTVSGNCFGNCTQSAIFSTVDPTFRFALSTSGSNTWSSRISDNSDDPKDHMVTWKVVRSNEAHPNNPVGAYVIAWEDLPDASDDGDYNDLVVEVTGDVAPAICGDFVVSGAEECDADDATCCACRDVDLTGTEGVDTIDIVAEGFPGGAVVHALGGADTVIGSESDDVICGGTGPDTLTGNGGNDLLLGQDNADQLFGGAGDDHLLGGGGADDLTGGSGADVLEGGAGADQLFGGSEDDILHGGDGADKLFGDGGFDLLVGGQGPDNLDGGGDDDLMFGDTEADSLDGGAGNDVMFGGPDTDTLSGGPGNDTLDGEAGNRDKLFGDEDDDDLDGGSGRLDLCDGGDGIDTATSDCESVIDVP